MNLNRTPAVCEPNKQYNRKTRKVLQAILFLFVFSFTLPSYSQQPPVEHVTVIGQRTNGGMTPEQLAFLYAIIQMMLGEYSVIHEDEAGGGWIEAYNPLYFGCGNQSWVEAYDRIEAAVLVFWAFRAGETILLNPKGQHMWDNAHSNWDFGVNWGDGSYGIYHVTSANDMNPISAELSCTP